MSCGQRCQGLLPNRAPLPERMLRAVSTIKLETWRATCNGDMSATSFLTFARPNDCSVTRALPAFADCARLDSARTGPSTVSFGTFLARPPAPAFLLRLGAMPGLALASVVRHHAGCRRRCALLSCGVSNLKVADVGSGPKIYVNLQVAGTQYYGTSQVLPAAATFDSKARQLLATGAVY